MFCWTDAHGIAQHLTFRAADAADFLSIIVIRTFILSLWAMSGFIGCQKFVAAIRKLVTITTSRIGLYVIPLVAFIPIMKDIIHAAAKGHQAYTAKYEIFKYN